MTNESLTSADIKNLTSGDILNGVLAEDFGLGQLPKGDTRPAGSPARTDSRDHPVPGSRVRPPVAHLPDLSQPSLANGAVTSANVLDDNQAGGGLGPSDLATNAVAQAEIATDGVAATEIQNDSIDSGEIVDFGLSNQDVGVLFAEVSATAALDNHSGGVTVTRIGADGAGQYEVDFGAEHRAMHGRGHARPLRRRRRGGRRGLRRRPLRQ